VGKRQAKQLSATVLKRLYVDKEMSPQDIGDVYGISRQAVHDRLKKFGIPVRNKSQARLAGIRRGRVTYDYGQEEEDQETGEMPDHGDEPETAADRPATIEDSPGLS
jgi:hypothetical protein